MKKLMMKLGKKKLPQLLVNFMGKNVRIATMQNASATIMTENGPIVENYPLVYEGILIDDDAEFYYLGKNISNISIRVRKTHEVGMEVVDEEDPLDEILKRMPTPQGNMN